MSTASILDLPNGIHRDVAGETYHARVLGVASKHALDRVHQSLAHYKAWVDGTAPEVSADALTFGQTLHCALLEPKRFQTEYVVEPDFGDCRYKDAKTARDAWRLANAGRMRVSAADMATVRGVAASIQAHPVAGRMLCDGAGEVTAKWIDRETGLVCKARADYYVPSLRMIVDVKSAEDASEDAFRRTVMRYGYHRQHAFYVDGFATCGEPVSHFVFLAAEKTPPYAIAMYVLDASAIAKGRESIRRDVETLADAISSDTWPAYQTGIQSLSLPDWST